MSDVRKNDKNYIEDVCVFDRQAFLSLIDKSIQKNDPSSIKLCQRFNEFYHVDTNLRRSWASQIKEKYTGEEQLSELLSFYKDLLPDNRNTLFYLEYLTFIIENRNNFSGEDGIDDDAVESIFQKALLDTEYDFLNGQKIWRLYTDYLGGFEDVTKIREAMMTRLRTPHKQIDETFQYLSQYISDRYPSDYNEILPSASKIYNKTKESQFELELLYSSKAESREEYWSNILKEVSSVPKKQRNIRTVTAVFENAITEIESESFWYQFLLINYQYGIWGIELFDLLERFIKRFPTSHTPHVEYLRSVTSFPNPLESYNLVKERHDYLLGLESDYNSWKNSAVARLGSILKLYGLGNDSFRAELYVSFEKFFKVAIDHEDDVFHTVERFIVSSLESIGDIELARKYLQLTASKFSSNAEGWLISHYFEKRHGDYNSASRVLKAAISRSEQLDWPERIFEEALRYEEVFGDGINYSDLISKIHSKQDLINESRSLQQSDPDLHEIYDADETVSTEIPLASSKKRTESNADLESLEDFKDSKKPRLRNREATTVAVRNIPLSTTEKQIRFLFKDCGEINDIHTVSLETSLQSNVEFHSEESVSKALTKDYKKIGNQEIRVVKLVNSTVWVTNFPPAYTEDSIKSLFSSVGDIASIRFPSLRTDTLRRFCYVEFVNSDDASKAVSTYNGLSVDDHTLTVKISDPSQKQTRKKLPSEEGREVYVSKLDFYKVDSNRVKNLFAKYGDVESVHLPLSESNRSKRRKHDGYGFVVFSNPEEAVNAVLGLNLTILENRAIEVSISKKKLQRQHEKESKALKTLSHSDNSVALKNVPDTISASQLKGYFSEIGEVKEVILEPEYNGAIVSFDDAKSVGESILRLNGLSIGDNKIEFTTVSDLRKTRTTSTSAKPFVPSSIRRRDRLSTSTRSPASVNSSNDVGSSSSMDNTTQTGKSNADFRAMLLGKK